MLKTWSPAVLLLRNDSNCGRRGLVEGHGVIVLEGGIARPASPSLPLFLLGHREGNRPPLHVCCTVIK
jgi:hypothetical protein